MEIKTKTKIREWGNSLGIVIPKEIVIKERLHTNDDVIVTISKKDTLEDFFGKLKNSKIDPQKMKNENRKIWEM
ncbi:MAG: AbrB/MazE/SpoVT family DNA-binding domain-containing protein [Nanoarchaeota archaeon]